MDRIIQMHLKIFSYALAVLLLGDTGQVIQGQFSGVKEEWKCLQDSTLHFQTDR